MNRLNPVTEANCIEIAQEIVSRLKGKSFGIVSSYSEQATEPDFPKISPTSELRNTVVGDFTYLNGKVTIPLSPSRNITWDLKCEKVIVVFETNGIIIKRILPHNKTLFRSITL